MSYSSSLAISYLVQKLLKFYTMFAFSGFKVMFAWTKYIDPYLQKLTLDLVGGKLPES